VIVTSVAVGATCNLRQSSETVEVGLARGWDVRGMVAGTIYICDCGAAAWHCGTGTDLSCGRTRGAWPARVSAATGAHNCSVQEIYESIHLPLAKMSVQLRTRTSSLPRSTPMLQVSSAYCLLVECR
jgi:hypothetical protein